MTPIKTGAHIYLEEYGIYYVGDLWQVGDDGNGAFVAKCNVNHSYEPLRNCLHLKIGRIGQYWKDQNHHYILCQGLKNTYLGYDGVSLKEAFTNGR